MAIMQMAVLTAMLFPLRGITHSVIYTPVQYQTVNAFDNSGNYRITTGANTADYIQLALRYRGDKVSRTCYTRPFKHLALIIPSYDRISEDAPFCRNNKFP